MNYKSLLTGLGVLAFAAARVLAAAADKPGSPPKKVSYYKDVRPVFQANCQGCHQPAKARSGYVMTDFKLMLGTGDSKETAIVPKSPEKSHLVQLITPKADGKAEMPEGRKALTRRRLRPSATGSPRVPGTTRPPTPASATT